MQTDQVRSYLGGAIANVESAESQLYVVKQLVEAALQTTDFVRQGSIDPIGVPLLHQVLQEVERVLRLTAQYKETANTYLSVL